MLLLLPPSEGKTPPPEGEPPVDLARLAFADRLTKPRERLLRALKHRQGDLTAAPAAPAAAVYTGVLYQRLDFASVMAPNPDVDVLIASGLWGFTRPQDRIPAYKLPIDAKDVPRLKQSLAAFWRPLLAKALPGEPGFVVDMRSGGYVNAFKPPASTLQVNAETPDGSTITHFVKATRGDVARLIIEQPTAPETADDVLQIVRAGGHQARIEGSRLIVTTA